MRSALAVVVAALAPALAAGQEAEERYASKDGRYVVQFPGRPKESTHTTRTNGGGDLKVHAATYATGEGNVLMVSYTDLPAVMARPENHKALFDGVRTGYSGKDGKVVTTREVEVGKEKGREVVLDKGKQQVRYRVAVRDGRLYQVVAIGTGEFVTGPGASAFLGSFEFVK